MRRAQVATDTNPGNIAAIMESTDIEVVTNPKVDYYWIMRILLGL